MFCAPTSRLFHKWCVGYLFSVEPQAYVAAQPELLSGTLRENLDPFHEHSDAVLNAALRATGLFSLQSHDDGNDIALDSHISSGGGNLSVGQRQLLALARALVRGSKLLILDEGKYDSGLCLSKLNAFTATSSIDYEADAIIQSSLRSELGGDVTVLTVAHRLQTIMDADKIVSYSSHNDRRWGSWNDFRWF
jgi:ABC-type multidrug transport system fused ATPase/permease subunit